MANRKGKPSGEAASILGRMWANYNLSIVLLSMFLASWIGQFISQWIEFRNEAHEHGSTFEFWDFFPAFWQATLENWQSEFLQLLTFVTLTAFLIHRGSPESRDGTDEMRAKLDAIQQDLKELRRAQVA